MTSMVTLIGADEEWLATLVGFVLKEEEGVTDVRFYHTGWPKANEHDAVSWLGDVPQTA